MNITSLHAYIRPELVILPVVLYAIGMGLKQSSYFKDNTIPILLGFISIGMCGLYVLSVSPYPEHYQDVLGLIFDILVQGVSCASAAVYADQIGKQMKIGQSNQSQNSNKESEDDMG